MSIAPEMVLSPRLEQRLSPELVAFAAILALPLAELEEAVEHELEQNPALERDDDGEHVSGAEYRSSWDAAGGPSSAGSPDYLAGLSASTDEHERLRSEARILCGATELALVDVIVDALDEHGFLPDAPDQLAADNGVPLDVLHRVIAAVREAGPPGIAAHDVRECLLLQLAELEAAGVELPLARDLVTNHLSALARGSYAKIARALGVERDEVLAARDLICARLRPDASLESRTPGTAGDALAPKLPDMVIRELASDPEGYEVELVERARIRVRLNPFWERVLRDCDTLATSERRFIELRLQQSRSFLARLEQRKATLLAVARYVIEHQSGFIRCGRSGLRPLTRSRVAYELGIHESTVSRAVAGKYVQLPTGHVVSFADFFESAGPVHEALATLVGEESRPLSDGELATKLASRGFRVARRTVAKYRDRLGIPTHALR